MATGTSTNWAAPTETEWLLHTAGLRGDVEAQLRVLAREEELYIGAPKAEADARPDLVTWRSYRDPSGWQCKPVLTRGMLPPWHPDWVFHGVSLKWIADFGWRDPNQLLAVNAGTPAQVFLSATPDHRAVWRRIHEETERPDGGRLIALRHGALHGPLAYGLACGAHLSVSNGVPWNEVGTAYRDYTEERTLLRDLWGITEPSGWKRQLDALLDARNSPADADFVLRVREELRAGLGEPPPPSCGARRPPGTPRTSGRATTPSRRSRNWSGGSSGTRPGSGPTACCRPTAASPPPPPTTTGAR